MNYENCEKLIPWTLQEVESLLTSAGFFNVVREGDAVRCSCPHGLVGKDAHNSKNLSAPAYQVTITKEGWMRGHCHACQVDGEWDDVEILLHELMRKIKVTDSTNTLLFKRLGGALLQAAEHHLTGVYAPSSHLINIPEKVFEEYPKHLWNFYQPATQSKQAMAYLQGRGLSLETIQEMDIRFCWYSPVWAKTHEAHLFVGFPYRNGIGRRAGIRWRCTSPDSAYTEEATAKRGYQVHKHTPFLHEKVQCNSSLTWFRESELDASLPIVVVEGQFDVAAILPIYKNVTCLFKNSAGFKKLEQFSCVKFVIWLGDNDGGAGDKGRPRAKKYFESHGVGYLDLYYPEGYKDAGETPLELLKPLILKAVDNFVYKFNPTLAY